MSRSLLTAVISVLLFALQTGASLLRGVARSGALLPTCSLDTLPLLCRNGSVGVYQRGSQRKLRFGDLCASETVVNCLGAPPSGTCQGACGECPCEFDASGELSMPNLKTMFASMGAWCSPGAVEGRVLSIGLGGAELPQYLLRRCPGLRIETVELSEQVISTALNFFGLRESQHKFGGRISVEQADALAAVEQRANSAYDVVLVDCFNGQGSVPETCRSRRFAEQIRRVLRPSGIMLQNIWANAPGSPDVAAAFQATVRTYGDVFKGSLEELSVEKVPGQDPAAIVEILRMTQEPPCLTPGGAPETDCD